MTNNPVPIDRLHVYAFSTKRLVLFASLVLMLVALGMMLGIRIERQQQAQAIGHRPAGEKSAKKVAALPTASTVKKNKRSTAQKRVAPTQKDAQTKAASSQEKPISKAATSADTDSKSAEKQPAPTQPATKPPATKKVAEAEKTVAPEKPISRGHYAVQVEASQDKEKAALQVEILKKKGLKAYVEPVDIKGKGLFYRVMVGPFQTKKQARDARDLIKEDSRFTESFIKYLP